MRMRLTTRKVTAALLGCLFLDLLAMPLQPQAAAPIPKLISIRQEASDQKRLAAYEIQRYVYLRTGLLLTVKKGSGTEDRIVVSRKDRSFCGEIGHDLGDEGVLWACGGYGCFSGGRNFAE